MKTPGSVVVRLLLCVGFLSPLFAGCRSGAGSSCLTDSDCRQGFVCIHKEAEVDGRVYPRKTGRCGSDPDQDAIADDGDFSGSSVDNRCGVHVELFEQTQTEVVYEQVVGRCDDNCSEVGNTAILTRFDCTVKDDCCPLSEEQKQKAEDYHRCSDKTDEQDRCAACLEGDYGKPSPRTCFLEFEEEGGYDLDEHGCIHCRPLRNHVECTVDEKGVDSCASDDRLPVPACSGRWVCNSDMGFCTFKPRPFKDLDEEGNVVLYQLDRDWDGVGDQCDNCPNVPNGVECRNPSFAYRCDADGDGETTPQELSEFADQLNDDHDRWGNACDLCPGMANESNRDLDGDGAADPCDPDDDGDGICDPGETDWTCTGADNCIDIPNEAQKDKDQDGIGDVCDPDKDGDEIRENGDGKLAYNPCNPETGPCCDDPPCFAEEEGEIFLCRDCDDNCPNVSNPEQLDSDGDGVGDACDD